MRLLLGPAGSGKTFRCLTEIREALLAAPDGPPLALVAPKQATYQLERQLLNDPKVCGYTRLYVLSFERLAWFGEVDRYAFWFGRPDAKMNAPVGEHFGADGQSSFDLNASCHLSMRSRWPLASFLLLSARFCFAPGLERLRNGSGQLRFFQRGQSTG